MVRVDYNVPLKDGLITDDYRIQKSLPTIQYLISQNCKIVLCSHLGRPTGPEDKSCSLAIVARRLSQILDQDVAFETDALSDESKSQIAKLEAGQILLLENLRFYSQEEANDEEFARRLSEGCEVFVQDGFGVVHRAHGSTDAITRFLPSVAGLLIEKEVVAINSAIEDPKRPLMALIRKGLAPWAFPQAATSAPTLQHGSLSKPMNPLMKPTHCPRARRLRRPFIR